MIDGLAVISTSHTVNTFLVVPDIPIVTDLEISSPFYEVIDNCRLTNSTEAFVFEPTASNTRKFNKVCSSLEREI